MEYISKYVDLSLINKRNFNIISSGTGTGKTWFIANEFKTNCHILNHMRYFL